MACQLAILGAGELEDELKELSSSLEIGEYVHFLGWQANPFKYISKATAFVSPSLTEGFGLAVLEAMSCGAPVIATDCPGGQGEIVGEFGVLVRVGDEQELVKAMVEVLSDSLLRDRLKTAGFRRARDFTQEQFVEGYRKLLQ